MESEEASEIPSVKYPDPVPSAEIGGLRSSYESEEWVATVIGQTPTGGVLQVLKRSDGSGYKIGIQGGGRTPNNLEGWFTSYPKAEQAARLYLNQCWVDVA